MEKKVAGRFNIMLYYKELLLHVLLLALGFVFFQSISDLPLWPSEWSLIHAWDTIHYNSIKEGGYVFFEDKQSNVAFFPGFPYFWKFTGLNATGISVLNVLLFAISTIWLGSTYKWSKRQFLLVLAIPSIMFMYVPYSEALFYFFSAMILIGMRTDKLWLILTGLFFASITRSAANVFIPALIICAACYRPVKVGRVLILIFTSSAAVFTAILIQYLQTGEWFGYMKSQKFWFHSLQMPKLPLTTWGDMTALDYSTLLCGCFFIFVVIRTLIGYLKGNKSILPVDIFFSMLVLSGLCFFALLMKGGNLFSLNRYLMPTAFFAVAMNSFYPSANLSGKKWVLAVLGIALALNIFCLFPHIKVIIAMTVLALYLGLALNLNSDSKRVRNGSFYTFYIGNTIIQAYLLSLFLSGNWVA